MLGPAWARPISSSSSIRWARTARSWAAAAASTWWRPVGPAAPSSSATAAKWASASARDSPRASTGRERLARRPWRRAFMRARALPSGGGGARGAVGGGVLGGGGLAGGGGGAGGGGAVGGGGLGGGGLGGGGRRSVGGGVLRSGLGEREGGTVAHDRTLCQGGGGRPLAPVAG